MSKVDQNKVFLARPYGVVVSMTNLSKCMCTTERGRWLGRYIEAQTNVENLSVSTFQIVALDDGDYL